MVTFTSEAKAGAGGLRWWKCTYYHTDEGTGQESPYQISTVFAIGCPTPTEITPGHIIGNYHSDDGFIWLGETLDLDECRVRTFGTIVNEEIK